MCHRGETETETETERGVEGGFLIEDMKNFFFLKLGVSFEPFPPAV